MSATPALVARTNTALDAAYATWTADPALDPMTAEIYIPFGVVISNYLVALILSTACVSVRIYVRRVMIRELARDDLVLIVAYISYVAYIVFMVGLTINMHIRGLQRTYWSFYELTSVWELLFILNAILIRAAIATFFLRALPRYEHSLQRWTIIVVFWLYAIFMTIFGFLWVWQCGNPLKQGFNDVVVCKWTEAMDVLPVVARAFTMVLDWIMTILPVFIVCRSSMHKRAKLSVIGIMVLAGMGSTVSILSIVYNDLGFIWYPSDIPDFMIYSIFSLWENGAGIIVISLAAMRPLFRSIIDRQTWIGTRTRSIQPVVTSLRNQSLSASLDVQIFQSTISATAKLETLEEGHHEP